MLSVSEARRSFSGVWRIFRGRADGLKDMDRSVPGFWRSFATILLVLPSDAVTLLAMARTDETVSFGNLFFGRLPVVALDWVALPLVLAFAARPLGVSGTYVDYVVARNWGAPLAAAVMALPFLLFGAGWISGVTTTYLSVAMLGLVLRYQWLVLRLALRASVAMSVALLIVDILVSLLLMGLFSGE